MDKQLSTALL